MVQMHVGDEDCLWQLAIVSLIGGQPLAAAIDGQPGRTGALERGHRRAKGHRRRIADSLHPQAPVHQ